MVDLIIANGGNLIATAAIIGVAIAIFRAFARL